ncbi:hypothetical protein [Paracidovorax cattleyae]|uniref:hypothetical protein n=1 Tax=Paracidovorax cattleyae TaxID=80868 RepID=UPI00115F82D7|nr:hypothetical protein [Paracidovorax cattleyae]
MPKPAKHPSQWACIESIASKSGCTAQTLDNRVKQHERDTNQREGPSTEEVKRIKNLEPEVRELRRANEILKMANGFFAQVWLDRRLK